MLPPPPAIGKRTVDLRRRWWLGGALLALALTARVVVFELGSDRLNNDEQAYLDLATEIAAGRGLARQGQPETHILPLFPLLHAVPVALGAPPQIAGRAIALLSSAAAAPLALWLAWPLLGRRWSLLAGIAVALHPRLLVTAERLQPEALAALGLLAVAGLLVRARPDRALPAAALCYLSRPEGLFLLPAIWIAALAAGRARWRGLLLPTALACLLIAPYLIHLRIATGGWTPIGKASWIYTLGVLEARTPGAAISHQQLERAAVEIGSPWRHLRQRPGEVVTGYLVRLRLALSYLLEGVYWPLALLAAVGLAAVERRRALLVPLSLIAIIPLAFVNARHLLPYLPLVLVLATVGAQAVWLAICRGWWRWRSTIR